MIELNRIQRNGTFFVNPDLIEVIEARPDTIVTLVNKHRYVVAESVADVVDLIIEYRARIASTIGATTDNAVAARVMPVIVANEEEQAA